MPIEVFNGQELHTSQEQGMVAEYFRNIVSNAQLIHIARLDHQFVDVLNSDGQSESTYTQTRLQLGRADTPESTLGLNGGRLEIAIQTTSTDNPADLERSNPAVIDITFVAADGQRGAQVIYRLGADGIVRREDALPTNIADDVQAEAASNMVAINTAETNETRDRAWHREIERQLQASENRNGIKALETALLLNRQPVGKSELDWLDEVLRYSQ